MHVDPLTHPLTRVVLTQAPGPRLRYSPPAHFENGKRLNYKH
jgi:hypothetical protein